MLLGAGIPLLPPPYSPTKLRLISHHLYRGVYSVGLLGAKPEIPVDAVFAFITVNQT